MVRVDLSTAIFVYLLFSLIGIIFAWTFYEYRYKSKRPKKSEENIFKCPICAYSHIVGKGEIFKRCPRCNTLNKVK